MLDIVWNRTISRASALLQLVCCTLVPCGCESLAHERCDPVEDAARLQAAPFGSGATSAGEKPLRSDDLLLRGDYEAARHLAYSEILTHRSVGAGTLASLFLDGLGVAKHEPIGLAWAEEAARGGDVRAQAELCWRLLTGKMPKSRWAGSRDAPALLSILLESAKEGSLESAYRYGRVVLELGYPAIVNQPAEHWLEAAARAGNHDAATFLFNWMVQSGASASVAGRSTLFDLAMTLDQLGLPSGARYLGRHALGEFGDVPNLRAAAKWFDRAAKLGDREAAGRLGGLIESSGGALGTNDIALHWYRIGAMSGSRASRRQFFRLASEIYRNRPEPANALDVAFAWEQGWSGRTDLELAQKYYLIAVEAGLTPAKHRLATLYLRHWKTLRMNPVDSRRESVRLLEEATASGYVDSITALGTLLMFGSEPLRIVPNPAAAEAYLTRAAHSGDSEAIELLAKCYAQGRPGLPKDQFRAAAWLRHAVVEDSSTAKYELARLCETHPELRTDARAIFGLYRDAALKGSVRAAERLGILYEYGVGTPRDKIAGVAWLGQAAMLGSLSAERALESSPDLADITALLALVAGEKPPND